MEKSGTAKPATRLTLVFQVGIFVRAVRDRMDASMGPPLAFPSCPVTADDIQQPLETCHGCVAHGQRHNQPEMIMDIAIGSNQLRNTNGIFVAQDQDLIKVERHAEDRGILLSMDLYNPAGTRIARLERNQWTSNEHNRFEIQTSPESVTLVDHTLKGSVFSVQTHAEDSVHVPQAKFYLPGGTVSEVTADSWHIGNRMELKNADIDLQGGPIEIQ